jgi:adenylate cyclase
VVVTAELTRTGPSPRRLWGEAFDRSSGDVLDIESAIATAVATAVAGQLQPADRATLARRPTRDPEAYLLYQRARSLFNRGLIGFAERDLRAADAFYDAALERDSNFAAAWAGKAETWAWMADDVVPGSMGYARVRRYAARALALDSTIAAAHAYMAAPLMALDRDWAGAEAAARRAIAVDPRSPTGWMSLALVNWCQGRFGATDSAMARAWSADSMSSAVQLFMAASLGVQRRYAEMRAFADREDAAGMADGAAFTRGSALSFMAPDSALRLDSTNIEYLAHAGRLADAREALRRLRARRDSLLRVGAVLFEAPDNMALRYAAVGDLDQAFFWIGRAIDSHTGGVVTWLKVDPRFDGLRSDPRYPEMLRRLNLNP